MKQIARDNIKLNNKESEKELAKKKINPFCFIDKKLKIGSKGNLESHNINHASSVLTITPFYPVPGIDTSYISEFLKELATTYARLINKKNLIIIYFFS